MTHPPSLTQTPNLCHATWACVQVSLSNITAATRMFSLLGPGAANLMRQVGAGALRNLPHGSHTILGFGGKPVVAAVGGGLPGEGFTLVCDELAAPDLWRVLSGVGAVPMGAAAWEVARVLAGRPAVGAELTEDYNPLEAALYSAVSITKGCYVGQETIAKVSLGEGMEGSVLEGRFARE